MKEPRQRAKDFLELVQRGRRGRLKLYLGFAAGVGKTYRMLEEAHALRQRGIDAVMGVVETHGRPATAALMDGLEAVPLKTVSYRGVQVQELDVAAVLERRAEVVLIDEIAHTNAPTSPHRKRYEDVEQLLSAGINVIGALNIQHLESLVGLVHRVTGVKVRETVPDAFLKAADQVVNVDLTVEDLQERLRSGQIYPPDKVAWAQANFFKDENLHSLREVALREVAESLERSTTKQNGASMPAGSLIAHRRVLVCMSSYPPFAAPLLNRGSRMAGRLNTDWFVVYVQTPREAPLVISAETQRRLISNMEQARELGAEFVTLQSYDPVNAIIDFARAHNVGHIIIGRSHQPWWRQVFGRSLPLRLVREGRGFDLHIVSLEAGEGSE
ncbi:MAG TPA: histidine kinase [Myxococcota bacterium]|nr:histidine kinase [Myxococcota bacterium]